MSEGLEPVKNTIEAINARMKERMAYWEKLPLCPDCGQAKETEPCRNCEQKKQWEAIEAAKQRETDIIRLGGLKAYETFTMARYDDKNAISACDGWPGINLFIHGPAGSGKTHLATAISRGYGEVKIRKPQHIFRSLRGIKDGAEEQAAINKYVKMPFLIIDDLGVDKKTDFSFSTLYEILDGRDMDYRNGLIITSNLSVGGLAERLGDDRIASRIAGMCRIVEIKGKDRRIS
jgi:DNA replication protein DnaC